MKLDLSRRLFLGGTAAMGAVASSGLLVANSANAEHHKKFVYGPPKGIAKLNANENPYGPSKAAIAAAQESIVTGGAYYAYPAALKLMDMIAEKHGIGRGNVTLTAGSSPILSYVALAASEKGVILGPDLFWDTTSRAPEKQGGAKIKRVANGKDLGIDLDAMYDAIDDKVGMVQITNPNNPTGTIVDPVKLKEFCIKASKKTLVLVDEAYNELTDDPPKHSMIPLVKAGHNVVVARTFSKIYGMAGMRVGYLIASEENIEWVNRYGLGAYTLNQAGLAAAITSYNDEGFLRFSKDKANEAKAMVSAALKQNGLTALPSSTNFMFVDLGKSNANDFQKAMEAQKVMIRGVYRDYTNWSRVSMGKIEDVQMYVDALPKALEAIGHS